jgi:ribosomal protein L16 Arg81 hydroxylase
MIASLKDLVAPLTEAGFSVLLRNRAPTLRRCSGDNRFDGLLDWRTLRGLVETGVIPPHEFKITRNAHTVPPFFYVEKGKVNAANLANLLSQGASLVTNPIEQYVPGLGALCEDIRARFGEASQADAVVTTGSGGALPLHYDPPDVIVLQIEGSKRWRLYGPPVTGPIKGMPKPTPPQGEPLFDETLRPGDLLIVPAGYWHHCDNGPGLSLHIAIVIVPPTGWHALKALLPQLLTEEIFRLPITRLGSEAEIAAHEATLKTRLTEKIRQMPLSRLFAESNKNKIPTDRHDD